MRGVLLTFGFLGVVLVLLFVTAVWNLNGTNPVLIDGTTLQVDHQGNIYQGNQFVSRFRIQPDQTFQARLQFKHPEQTVDPEIRVLEIDFETDNAKSVIKDRFISLQTTELFHSLWRSNDRIDITIDVTGLASEAALQLEAPVGYFQPSVLTKCIDFMLNLPFLAWFVLGLLLVGITKLYLAIRFRPFKWEGGEERPTPPGDLRPIELALLKHGTLRSTDLAAMFYDLCERGYVQIYDRGEGDVVFARTSKSDDLKQYEKNFLLLLFPNEDVTASLLSVLQNMNRELFSAVVNQLYIEIYDRFTQRGFFQETPRELHLRYKTIGLILQIMSIALALFSFMTIMHNLPEMIILSMAMFVSGNLIYYGGLQDVPLSRLGKELVKQSSGFELYLKNPKPLPWAQTQTHLFYRYTPFALTVGVAQPWLNRFREHTRWEIPDWYTNMNEMVVRPDQFVNQIDALGAELARYLHVLKDPNVD